MRHPALERDSITPLTWALFAAVLLLAASVGAFGLYLKAHQAASDRRDERWRQAICGILNQFPPGANTQLDNGRLVFGCVATLRHPSPAPTRSGHSVKPRPARTVTVTPTPRVIATPGPTRLIVTPGPTVTVTKTQRQKQPTPSCTTLTVNRMCVKIPLRRSPLGGLLHLPH